LAYFEFWSKNVFCTAIYSIQSTHYEKGKSMAKIEGIRIVNFRGLKDIMLGKLGDDSKSKPLTDMTVVIGKNGVGKSTLFDVFGFLADALKFGVEEACDLRGRGGFEKIRSKGQIEAIQFHIKYSESDKIHPFCYSVIIDMDENKRPFVRGEAILQQLNENSFSLALLLDKGIGFSLSSDASITDGEPINVDQGFEILSNAQNKAREMGLSEIPVSMLDIMAKDMGLKGVDIVALTDNRKLGIVTLGALKQHPQISDFRQFMEGWYLSYFTPDAARSLPLSGAQQHLNSKGDNLANVVQFMEREHRDSFQSILNRIAGRIPGIDKIDTEKTSDGRLLLRFNDRGFQDPFYAPQMSDGTLKVFAYLLLLENPAPPPLICIEEPENGLYHKLLEILAAEFRAHTLRKDGSQLFITTHQPYFVDALEPEEVWILEKGDDGFSTIRRASDDELVKNMVAEGLPLGGLWYSDYLDAR
jgi:predicted ATPase